MKANIPDFLLFFTENSNSPYIPVSRGDLTATLSLALTAKVDGVDWTGQNIPSFFFYRDILDMNKTYRVDQCQKGRSVSC